MTNLSKLRSLALQILENVGISWRGGRDFRLRLARLGRLHAHNMRMSPTTLPNLVGGAGQNFMVVVFTSMASLMGVVHFLHLHHATGLSKAMYFSQQINACLFEHRSFWLSLLSGGLLL